jgi:predicted transcriptional regulator of viral defense system
MTTNAPPTATRPDRDRLYDLASAQDGYFTTAQAAEAGYSTHLLFHHMSAGTVLRARRGVYRLVHFPAGEHEDLTVLWLWSGQEGVYSHETALSLHGLSDALPEVRHMILPLAWRSRRLRVPDELLVSFADVDARDRGWAGAVPVTAPARTIADCVRAHVSSDLIRQALQEGLERGLFRWPVVAADAHAVALRRPRRAA